MNAEIIAVGSELLLGQIANTNAQFLSQQLAELGVNVFYHTVVGDNVDRLKNAIIIAEARSDMIIFTGGLGPTNDDLTKETVADFLQKSLVVDGDALSVIQNYYVKTKQVMTENNVKQALIIEGSIILKNNHGMAPGMGLVLEKTYILLPGPPSEMKPMFLRYGRDFVLNRLEKREHLESRVLRYFGIGESKLETIILDLMETQTNPTIAPLAADGETTLRLTAKHESHEEAVRLIDEMEQKINERVGKYCYGYNNDTLMSQVVTYLKVQNKTIAAAESLTGGLFASELVSFAGASSIFKGGVVVYANEAKQQLLQVPEDVLQTAGAVSELCAEGMAKSIRLQLKTDIGISFTGVAGPDSVEGKDVGTVFIAIATETECKAYKLLLSGTRQGIRNRTMKYGCFYLLEFLQEKQLK